MTVMRKHRRHKAAALVDLMLDGWLKEEHTTSIYDDALCLFLLSSSGRER